MDAVQIHTLLLAEAARVSLPEAYKRDLEVHDLNQLAENGSQEFIWILRTCGTHLFALDKFRDTPGNRPSDLVAAMKGMGDYVMHFYHFSQGALKQVTYEQSRTIAREAEFRLHEKQRLEQRAAFLAAQAKLL